jgi:hypothetical protein
MSSAQWTPPCDQSLNFMSIVRLTKPDGETGTFDQWKRQFDAMAQSSHPKFSSNSVVARIDDHNIIAAAMVFDWVALAQWEATRQPLWEEQGVEHDWYQLSPCPARASGEFQRVIAAPEGGGAAAAARTSGEFQRERVSGEFSRSRAATVSPRPGVNTLIFCSFLKPELNFKLWKGAFDEDAVHHRQFMRNTLIGQASDSAAVIATEVFHPVMWRMGMAGAEQRFTELGIRHDIYSCRCPNNNAGKPQPLCPSI